MKKEDLQFKIEQLRNDKIIYAVEACVNYNDKMCMVIK